LRPWTSPNREEKIAVASQEIAAGTIASVFGADHQRLRAVWERFSTGVRACDKQAIRANFAEFETGLRKHIRAEEEALFPAFDAASGMGGRGPTAVMRAEHREFLQILDAIARLAAAGDCAGLARMMETGDPSPAFNSHDAKEEGVLYPMADRILSGPQKQQIAALMA
jgi:hemerythrin-like domain-containing protein